MWLLGKKTGDRGASKASSVAELAVSFAELDGLTETVARKVIADLRGTTLAAQGGTAPKCLRNVW